ncbi:APC family permease [Arthrobacter pascens]|uniref:APC family permease n=1 Tax=Arthrobacter pascens TaxID=1677 RepID=UPI00196ADAE5|nr:amino acid permease [Arthrobacter pascens]MBN3497871.1 amino acid permease [Arthrobacter pascens]
MKKELTPDQGPAVLPAPDSDADENQRLREFGYTPQLDRSIGRLSSFAIGFACISATTAVFSSFQAGYFAAGGPFVWTMLLALFVFGLWALIAADLAAKMPLAGYAYQWTSRINGSNLGWFTGFIAIIGWISATTSVAYTFAGYIGYVFGWEQSPTQQVLTTVVVITVCTLVVAYGVRLTTFLNNIGVSLEIVVTVGATLVVAAVALLVPENHQPFSVLFTEPGTDDPTPFIIIWLVAALGPFFGMIGVEASADVAEETKNARRVIPKTMFYALLASFVIELTMYIVYVLAIKDPEAVANATGFPIGEILSGQLGPVFAKIIIAIALTNIFACLLTDVLLATRLIYSLSRDNMLPFSRSLRHVAPRRKSPTAAVLTVGAVAILLTMSALLSTQTFFYFLGVCNLSFFAVYILQTGGLIVGLKRNRIPAPEKGTFDLGRWRLPLYILGLICFLIIEAGLILLPQFAGNGWVFLGVVAVAGLWWLLVLRGRLATGEAGPMYAANHPEEFAEKTLA